ncbi:hypothetical protein [Pseudomonas agarici]|uniref:hypothetical protein n=1 Tax=Pseudomonas agarici TaxID=46677 RepID=UPI0015A00C13|nr:hypothetical protein [Pseudomonas agarici]NWB90803.1 hypothetical protein [Pseudomonas agarici]
MNIFQRIVLLLKVLVMLALGTTAAWASASPPQASGVWTANSAQGRALTVADSVDEEQGDGESDDGPTTEEPDTGDDEESDEDT